MKQPQASDAEIADYLANGLRGHARYTNGHWEYNTGKWKKVRGPASPLWAHVDQLRDQLPADDYWNRARHRLSNIASTYTLLSLVAIQLRESS